MAAFRGFIMLWSGTVADIPAGWHLCDGTVVKTWTLPDLRDRFLLGAGSTYAPDDTAATIVAANAGIAYYALAYIAHVGK